MASREIKVGGIYVEAGFRTSKFERELDKFQRKLRKTGKSIQNLGRSLTVGLTGPLAGIGAAATAAALSFEQATVNIRRGTGATGDALKALEHDFREVFQDVPEDAGKVSTAIADLNTRLGLTGKPLQDLSRQTLQLSRITGEDLGSTIRSTTRLFGDYGVANEDASQTLDLLFKASQTTGIGVNQLSNQIVSYGATLRQFGFTLEESVALFSKFEKEGVNTEKVFSGLQQGLKKISTLGFDTLEQGLNSVFGAIKEAASDAEANKLAFEIFGSRAGADLAAAVREGRFELDSLIQTIGDSKETIEGAADATLTFRDRFQLLIKPVQTAFGLLGDPILDELEPLLKDAAAAVAELADKFNKLQPETKKNVVEIGAIGAAVGPALLGLGVFVSFVGGPFVKALALGLKSTTAFVRGVSLLFLTGGPWGIAFGAALGAVVLFGKEINKTLNEVHKDIQGFVQRSTASLVGSENSFVANFGRGLRVLTGYAQTGSLELATTGVAIAEVAEKTGKSTKEIAQAYYGIGTAGKKAAVEIEKTKDEIKKVKEEIGEPNKPDTGAGALANLNELLEGSKGGADEAAKALENLKKQISDFKRRAEQDSLRDSISSAISAGDFQRFEVLKEKYRESVKAGAIEGLDESVRETRAADEYGSLIANKRVEAITKERADELKDAHLDAVEAWDLAFRDTLGRAGIDLNNTFGDIAVSFGSELASSLFGGIASGFGDARALGSELGKVASEYIKAVFTDKEMSSVDTGQLAAAAASAGIYAGVVAGIAGAQTLSGDRGRFETGQGQVDRAQMDALTAGLSTIGLESLAPFAQDLWEGIADYPGAELLEPIQALQKWFGVFGTNNQETAYRKGMQEAFTEAIREATNGNGIILNSPLSGENFNLDRFNFRDTSDQFNEGGFEFLQSLSAEAQTTFKGLAAAFAEVFQLPDDTPLEQLEVLFAENLLGSIDNARILVQQLGVGFEELSMALLETARTGEISWLEFNQSVRGLEEAFKPGLAAADAVGQAFTNLAKSGGRGFAAIKSIRDLAIETLEGGGTDLADLRRRLTEEGASAEDIQRIMETLQARGVGSLEELANASDALAGAIVGDLDALGFGFEEITEEIRDVRDAMKEIEEISFDEKELRINVKVTGDPIPEDLLSPGDLDTLSSPSTRVRNAGVQTRSGSNVTVNVDATGAAPGTEQAIINAMVDLEDRVLTQAEAIANRAANGG